jgi:hypothetical protein
MKQLGSTNKTACVDGFVHAWKNWCKQNSDDCNTLAKEGVVPDAVRNETIVITLAADKDYYDN